MYKQQLKKTKRIEILTAALFSLFVNCVYGLSTDSQQDIEIEADTAEMVASRILTEEHRIYPEAIKTMLNGRWRIEGRRFIS